MSLTTSPHRIDPTHHFPPLGRKTVPPAPVSPEATALPAASVPVPSKASEDTIADDNPHHDSQELADKLLQSHAADLIAELQQWQRRLELQEAELNVRAAMQDQRERNFRVWELSQRADLSELQASAQRQHRSAKDLLMRLTAAEQAY